MAVVKIFEHVHFIIDKAAASVHDLNMFKIASKLSKSTATRAHILSTALQVFRERGLEAATMRDLAEAAGTSLGSAYYYFPSKEAIIQAYYDDVQAEHSRRVTATISASNLDLLERLRAAFHSKLDILLGDRKLIGTLFRFTGEPAHPLSTLGPATKATRQQSLEIFAQALGDERLPDDIRQILPTALWTLHLGMLLYFIYDESPNQQRTRKLVDGSLALLVRVLFLAKMPLLKPVRGSITSLLREAGLLPEGAVPSAPQEGKS
jgi:AcrR family transcriptional regulator